MVAFYSDETDLECTPSIRIARDGAYLISFYDACERPSGQRVRMAGVVPAGARRVRLERDGRTIARPRVVGGAWAARTLYPDVIAYGDRKVPTGRVC